MLKFFGNTLGTLMLKDQYGGLAILWAFILPLLMGFIGLGVEVSLWYADKNDLQSATDAAVVTTTYYVGSSTSLSAMAASELTRNGFGSSKNLTVTVNNPPLTGNYTTNNNAVELIVSEPQSLLFSAGLLSNAVSIQSRAVAVATPATSGTACVLGLSSATSGDIISSGNVDLSMPGCVIAADSSSSSSIILKGNVTVTLQNFYTVGNIQDTGSVTMNATNQNVINGAPVPDPFTGLTAPSSTPCGQNNFSAGKGNTIMSPGVYCGGISFDSQASVTMQPGTYVISGGDFKVNGGANVAGSGVTLVFTNNATFTWNGGGSVSLSAPTSGSFQGILMYGDRNNTSVTDTINGDSKTNLTGVIYAPTADLNFNGGASSGGSCTKLVAANVSFKGASSLTNTCPSGSGIPTIPVPHSVGSVVLKE